MNNDIEFKVSSNRNIAHTCCGCGETVPAGDYFVRTASEGGPECIECVKCVSDRIRKQECEARAAYEASAGSSYDKAEAALHAMAAGIPYREDEKAEADEKTYRELRSRMESLRWSLPYQCSACERYKGDTTYRLLMREWEGSKPWDTGAHFCDECFQKILFECRKCYCIYPHDPESRPGKRNADGVWVRDDRHICWDCYEREDTAKKLGVKQHTLILNEKWGNWVSPEREPELALHLGIGDAKEALYKAGMSQEAIDAKFAAEDAAYAEFLVAEEAKLAVESGAWKAHPSWGNYE
jgi:hypothetical protein